MITVENDNDNKKPYGFYQPGIGILLRSADNPKKFFWLNEKGTIEPSGYDEHFCFVNSRMTPLYEGSKFTLEFE